jgi:hypothetical protein
MNQKAVRSYYRNVVSSSNSTQLESGLRVAYWDEIWQNITTKILTAAGEKGRSPIPASAGGSRGG